MSKKIVQQFVSHSTGNPGRFFYICFIELNLAKTTSVLGSRRVNNPLDERDCVSGNSEKSKVGKASRLKKLRRAKNKNIEKNFTDIFTKNFQTEIRNSEIWDQMVAEFGEEKAERVLMECKAEVKPGCDI